MKEHKVFIYSIVLAVGMLLLITKCAPAKADPYLKLSDSRSVFVELGAARYNKAENGLWWQDGYPNSQDLNANYFRVGYKSGPFAVSFFNLGHYNVEALATNQEIDYHQGRCVPGTCKHPELYVTRGTLSGISLTLQHEIKRFELEGGVFLGKQEFHLRIYEVDKNFQPLGQLYNYDESRKGWGYIARIGYSVPVGKNSGVGIGFTWIFPGESATFRSGDFPSGIKVIKVIGVKFNVPI